MATVEAKQTFTMRNGEIRIPWRSTATIADKDVLAFIKGDSIYSKDEKWRQVFNILSFSLSKFFLLFKRTSSSTFI